LDLIIRKKKEKISLISKTQNGSTQEPKAKLIRSVSIEKSREKKL